ncbi:MAG: alpha/beta hydrolase fold domain-containing protein [Spirochaetota bacterium]
MIVIFTGMKLSRRTVRVLVIAAVAIAVLLFVLPAVQSMVTPMPDMVDEMVRESKEKPPVEGTVHQDLVYKRDVIRRHRLDIYEPVGVEPDGTQPLVVFFHGGSWLHGDKVTIRIIDRFLRRMREEGYFVASVNYTTSFYRGLGGPVENAREAVRWLGEEASRFGYDPHKLGLYGVSSGGHLALMAGSTMEEQGFSFSFLFAESSPTDLVAMKEGDAFEHSGVFRVFPERRLEQLSPINYVDADLPPVLLFHGEQDQTVHVSQSTRYAEALEDAGGSVELALYPDGDHAFLNLSDEVWYGQETRALQYFREQFSR